MCFLVKLEEMKTTTIILSSKISQIDRLRLQRDARCQIVNEGGEFSCTCLQMSIFYTLLHVVKVRRPLQTLYRFDAETQQMCTEKFFVINDRRYAQRSYRLTEDLDGAMEFLKQNHIHARRHSPWKMHLVTFYKRFIKNTVSVSAMPWFLLRLSMSTVTLYIFIVSK